MTPSVLSIGDPPGEVLTQIADAQLISRVAQDLNHYQEWTVCAREPNIVDWGRNGRVTDCCDVDSGSGDSVACRPRGEETSSLTGDSSVKRVRRAPCRGSPWWFRRNRRELRSKARTRERPQRIEPQRDLAVEECCYREATRSDRA